MFDDSKNFTNLIEDKEICIGKCTVKIIKLQQNTSSKGQIYEIDDGYELKSES